jgi:hypothetical protein
MLLYTGRTRDLSDGFTVVKFHKQKEMKWSGGGVGKTVKRERDSYTIHSCDSCINIERGPHTVR